MKIKRVIKNLKPFPWSLCLLVIMCLVSYAYADGIEDKLDQVDSKYIGKGGKMMLLSAIFGGGSLALFKANIWQSVGIVICAVLLGLSLYFVDTGLKI